MPVFAMDSETSNVLQLGVVGLVVIVCVICATALILHDKWPFSWPQRKDGP